MIINWLGLSCFKMQTRELTLVTDPYGPDTGLRPIKAKADLLTISHLHGDHNYLRGIMGEPFIIDEIGEYEVKGIYILGFSSFHDSQKGQQRGRNIIYRFFIEGITLVHLGDLGHLLTEQVVDQLGDVDILFVPVGDKYTLAVDKIPELVSAIEPRIVVPMHYKMPGLKYGLKPVSVFCSEMGVSKKAELDRLKIVKRDLEGEETRVQVLQKQ